MCVNVYTVKYPTRGRLMSICMSDNILMNISLLNNKNAIKKAIIKLTDLILLI